MWYNIWQGRCLMKKSNIFTLVGMLIYLILTIIDRFILKIANYIYIPIMIIGIIFLIVGIVENRKNKSV